MHSSLRMTSADLANFPDDNKRREIIDGELYVSTQPHWYHQVLCTRLGHFLGEWSDRSGNSQVAIAPGLIFAEDDDVVPDVVWASQERLAHILEGGKLYAAPELVIEVLSPGKKNIARDRETKLKLYARRDADEYWIADWPRHTIEIYRRTDDTLALAATVGPGDTLTTPLLSGFAVALDRLFAGFPFAEAVDEENGTAVVGAGYQPARSAAAPAFRLSRAYGGRRQGDCRHQPSGLVTRPYHAVPSCVAQGCRPTPRHHHTRCRRMWHKGTDTAPCIGTPRADQPRLLICCTAQPLPSGSLK